jgi:hypothetical protein
LVPGNLFLTAEHVMKWKDKLCTDHNLITETQNIPFTTEDTYTSTKTVDLSVIKNPIATESLDIQPAKLAALQPAEDSVVFHVGYPRLDPKLYGTETLIRTYTIGTYLYPTIQDGSFTQFCTGARLFSGYSGGAMFDENADLVGLNYSMEQDTHRRSWATSLFSEDAADQEISNTFHAIREAASIECFESDAEPVCEEVIEQAFECEP